MGYRSRHAAGEKKKRRIALIIRSAVVLAVLLVLLAPVFEARMLTVDTASIVCADLPADIGTLKIVYLSDIHWGSFFSDGRLNDLVSRVNAQNPDLILLGGDYAKNSDSAIAFFQTAPAFHARYAVLGVLGDCDRTLPESNLATLRKVMRDAGVTPLTNEATSLRIGSGTIYITGADDPVLGKPDIRSIASLMKRGDFVIFLCHNPSVIPSALNATDAEGYRGWFDLGLFGHTHGGQLPVVGRSMLGLGELPQRYMAGWLEENRTALLISHGVGTEKVPLRLFCRPQIHVITVRRK